MIVIYIHVCILYSVLFKQEIFKGFLSSASVSSSYAFLQSQHGFKVWTSNISIDIKCFFFVSAHLVFTPCQPSLIPEASFYRPNWTTNVPFDIVLPRSWPQNQVHIWSVQNIPRNKSCQSIFCVYLERASSSGPNNMSHIVFQGLLVILAEQRWPFSGKFHGISPNLISLFFKMSWIKF